MVKLIFMAAASLFIFSCAGKTKAPEAPVKSDAAVKTEQPKAEATKAQPSKGAAEMKLKNYVCKAGSDTRTVWTESLQPRGCKLWYSHFSAENPIAHSLSGVDYCFKVEDNILANLKKGGFECTMD
jgi:hypothetical protein